MGYRNMTSHAHTTHTRQGLRLLQPQPNGCMHRETDLGFYLGKTQRLPDLGKNLGKNQGVLLPSKNLGQNPS